MRNKLLMWMIYTGSVTALLVLLGLGYFVLVKPLLQGSIDNGNPLVANSETCVIVVQTQYPGEGAQTVAKEVAGPLEEQLSGMPKLAQMNSQSRNDGTYTLFLTFEASVDADAALAEVNNRLAAVQPKLPESVVQHGLRTRRRVPHPTLVLAVTSTDPTQFAEGILAPRLAQLEGVGDTTVLRAILDEKPAAVVAIFATTPETEKQLVKTVRAELDTDAPNRPNGVNVELIYEAGQSANLTIFVEIELSAQSSGKGVQQALRRASELTRTSPVKHVVTAQEPLFPERPGPWLLVLLDAKTERRLITHYLQRDLNEAFTEGKARVCDPLGNAQGPLGSYPIEFAITGPQNDNVLELTRALTQGMRKSDEVMTVWTAAEAPAEPRLTLTIDRAKALEMGIKVDEIIKLLQSTDAELLLKEMNPAERAWKFGTDILSKALENARALRLRNAKGEWVALRSLMKVEIEQSAPLVERLNRQPMTRVFANLSPDVSLDNGWKYCAVEFDKVRRELALPDDYKLVRLDAKP